MQVRRAGAPSWRSFAVLGLAVLPSLIPGGLGAGLPLGSPVVDAIVDVPAVAGRCCSSGTPARRPSSSTRPC